MPEEQMIMVCGHCDNRTLFEKLAEHKETKDDWEDAGSDLTTDYVYWNLLICLTCRNITLQKYSFSVTRNIPNDDYESKILYPVERSRLTDLPVAIEKRYRAALKVRKIEPNACAVLVGRTLEAACNHEKAQGKKLAEKLTYLANAGRIPQPLAEMAHHLKELRNLGAHDAEDDVTEEDVPIILDFLEAILEYLYVAPAKVAAVQARLKKTPKAAPQAP
jgi:hypothetical protein